MPTVRQARSVSATVMTKVGRRPSHADAANVANSVWQGTRRRRAPSNVQGLLDVDIQLRAERTHKGVVANASGRRLGGP